MTKKQRIFVYGSCVSRDTLEFLENENFHLAGYLARHSLLAEGTDASYKLPSTLEVTSAFQERMIRNDWQGDALAELTDRASTLDILLWDIIDERHGIHWFPTGEIVTRSVDLLASEPATSLLLPDTRILFGTDTHFDGWSEKAREFAALLEQHGLLEKTRLIRVNWAETSLDGSEVPWSMGLSAAEANSLYERYYNFLESLGVPQIRVPAEITQADPEHRWGLAPFHYAPAVYEFIGERLLGE